MWANILGVCAIMDDWDRSHIGGGDPYPPYSTMSRGVSLTNKGWDVLSCREKAAGPFN